LLRKQRKTLGGYFNLPHPVHGVLDLSTATGASGTISGRHNYANSVLYGSPSKNIALLHRAKMLQQQLLHKNHHTYLRSIHFLNPTGSQFNGVSKLYQVQAHLSYLQSDAHSYSTLPLISSYSTFHTVLLAFLGHLPLLISYKSPH